MNGINYVIVSLILIIWIAIVIAIRVEIMKRKICIKKYLLKVVDMEKFVKQVNWIMNYEGTLDFEDLTFIQCIREDRMISENNCTFKIVHNKSACITTSTKFFTLSILNDIDQEERHFTFKKSDIPVNQSIHIKTDHDHVEDLVCIKNIIDRVNKIYKKYIKIVV